MNVLEILNALTRLHVLSNSVECMEPSIMVWSLTMCFRVKEAFLPFWIPESNIGFLIVNVLEHQN